MVLTAVLGCLLVTVAHAMPQYRDIILNGHNIPNPCCPGRRWDRVGHMTTSGRAMPLNDFGSDFAANGRRFTEELCLADSDGDGMKNGLELGLVTNRFSLATLCKFIGMYPQAINFLRIRGHLGNAISHPGICDQRGAQSNCQPPSQCGC
ncbi:temptin-like [Ostrea edulis]|uniref:temptin-like n=1 Tax=Ostrea edulis TaxID=37623 RepID=UPI0020950F6E|nr:temptin-like [Ostrea edulis]